MRKRVIYLLGLLAVLVTATYVGWKLFARGAYESAEYSVVLADGEIEIRDYPDLVMATTQMQFQSQGNDGSFMRLFRYISGANDRNQKVAMTTPVFMEGEASDQRGQMGFVLPKKVSQQRVPLPNSENVEIQQRAGGRFAVIRFAGRLNSESMARAETKLRQWIDRQGLTADEEVESAGYDPPWTPGPWRRNEVLIRIDQEGN